MLSSGALVLSVMILPIEFILSLVGYLVLTMGYSFYLKRLINRGRHRAGRPLHNPGARRRPRRRRPHLDLVAGLLDVLIPKLGLHEAILRAARRAGA
jgi:hypothetical protein